MNEELEKVTLKDINLKNINWKTIKGLYLNYKEIINYLVFGGLTTIVNFVAYCIFARAIGIDEVLSSGIAWVCGVIFAYVTNRIFVFESKKKGFKPIALEMISFYIARIVSLICCDIVLFYLMVEICHINDVITKLILQVVVIVMNYVLSKFMIFKK